MAITVNGTLTTSDYNSTSKANVTLTVPTGAVVGEILVACIATGAGGGFITSPTGWTVLADRGDFGGTTGDANDTSVEFMVAYRVVTGSEAGSYTWTTAGGNTKYTSSMFRLGGVNTSAPIRVNTVNSTSTGAASWAAPATTGVQANDLELVFYGFGDALGNTEPAPTLPGTWTSVASRNVVSKGQIILRSNAAGAVTAPTVSGMTANTAWCAASVAFQAVGGTNFSGSVAVSGSGTASFAGTPKPTGTLAVSGSGAATLAGTPKPVSTLALSGAGTVALAGSPRAIAGSLPLSGAGALGLTGPPRITGTLDLTGGSTLLLSRANGSGSFAGSGSGALTLAGSPGFPGALDFTGLGMLALTGVGHRYLFRSPTQSYYYPLVPPPGHLRGVQLLGVNVFRVNGQWLTALMLSPEQEAAADRLYRGGYDYPLALPERDELIAAGFGDYIIEETA